MPTPLVIECELSAFLFSLGLGCASSCLLKTSGSLSVKDDILNAKIAKNPVSRGTFRGKNDNSPSFFSDSLQNRLLSHPLRPHFRTKKPPLRLEWETRFYSPRPRERGRGWGLLPITNVSVSASRCRSRLSASRRRGAGCRSPGRRLGLSPTFWHLRHALSRCRR